jgi:hypothetical protein
VSEKERYGFVGEGETLREMWAGEEGVILLERENHWESWVGEDVKRSAVFKIRKESS